MRKRGFTLAEMLTVVAVFSLVVLGILAGHLLGLKLALATQIKLGASDDARATISQLSQDIRGGSSVKIGTGSLTNFSEVEENTNQAGNALQIEMGGTTNLAGKSNQWVRYFYRGPSNSLERTVDGVSSALVTANALTNNRPIFSAINYAGNVNTSRQGAAVILVNLNYIALKNPAVAIGPGKAIDFYVLQTKATPRVRP